MRLTRPSPAAAATPADRLGSELSGLDRLELPVAPPAARLRRAFGSVGPKLAALAIAIGIWQLVVWTGWKPPWLLPGPATVLTELWNELLKGDLQAAAAVTLRRALLGYGVAIAVGATIGVLVVRWKTLRAAVGSLITGLQTMPSIAWFPLAILLFQLSETAILFVVVLGAAPAIANGLIAGIDNVPPLLLRAGRIVGARGFSAYRYIILPAALPSFVAGLKQGWAFAWRSLMAGELLVLIPGQPSIGARLQFARELSDAPGLIAMMIVILAIGIVVDAVFFSTIERSILARRGLVEGA
ncbi:MAG: sulfonate transport system permease protein [Chloroflexota bacterium]|nr:sulfonate transport system permease protein [Chloroflexota bacterium]